MTNTLFTVGHSNHSFEHFSKMLIDNDISVIADVRSIPYSRYSPHFCRETMSDSLKEVNIKYVFLGNELGAKRVEPECFVNNKVDYGIVSKLPLFKIGLKRIIKGIGSYRIAIMCSEKDPITCHRMILVTRAIYGFNISHIKSDSSIETNLEAENRLLSETKFAPDLFRNREEAIELAYRERAFKISYHKEASVL